MLRAGPAGAGRRPAVCCREVGDGGGEVLGSDAGGGAPGLALTHGVVVVAGIAVGPAGGRRLVGLALPFTFDLAPRLVLRVERAPRPVGQFERAAQFGARVFQLSRAGTALLGLLCPLGCPRAFARLIVERTQVSAGKPTAKFFGGLPRVGSCLRGGVMPAGALGVDLR